MGKDDTNYFLRRANEELEAAEHAVNVRAAQAHKELASLYLTMINYKASVER